MRRHKFAVGSVVMIIAMLIGALPAAAATRVDTSALRQAVTVDGVLAHMQAFEGLVDPVTQDRVAGSDDEAATRAYIKAKLVGAGYLVTEQPFQFPFFQELSAPVLQQTVPGSASYVEGDDFLTMEYSGAGDVTAAVQAVDLLLPPTGGSTSGCEAADFAGFAAGKIALIQRGTCSFAQKAQNAQAAGASAAIIFNEGNSPDRMGVLNGTLGGPVVTIPVLGATFALGDQLNGLIGQGLTLRVKTDTQSETRTSYNLIANTPGGRTDRVVLVGAHIDSQVGTPAINDDGSGAAVILEIALQMAKLGIQPRNQVRFAFWSGEEEGLLGSGAYAASLSARQVKDIQLNLAFDMLASNNYARFVYDGDGSSTGTAGPNGSKVIEQVFNDYFASQGLATDPTPLDNRTDYGSFTPLGIPAGGVFTGAEGIKTDAQAAVYGGTAGEPYYACYHEACDTVASVSPVVLDQMSDAAAHAVLTFAMTTSAVNGTDKGKANGQFTTDYQGDLLRR